MYSAEVLEGVKELCHEKGLEEHFMEVFDIGVWIASLRKTTLAYNFSIKGYHPKAKS